MVCAVVVVTTACNNLWNDLWSQQKQHVHAFQESDFIPKTARKNEFKNLPLSYNRKVGIFLGGNCPKCLKTHFLCSEIGQVSLICWFEVWIQRKLSGIILVTLKRESQSGSAEQLRNSVFINFQCFAALHTESSFYCTIVGSHQRAAELSLWEPSVVCLGRLSSKNICRPGWGFGKLLLIWSLFGCLSFKSEADSHRKMMWWWVKGFCEVFHWLKRAAGLPAVATGVGLCQTKDFKLPKEISHKQRRL